MTNGDQDHGGTAPVGEVSPEDYSSFIWQIELADIWLRSSHISNHHGPEFPPSATMRIEDDPSWENQPGGFRVNHEFKVQIGPSTQPYADISVIFALDYTSEQRMNDAIFSVFQQSNLPTHTWPYLREFLASITGRMNWMPFTLPTMKRGPNPAAGNSPSKEDQKAP